jgi:hypothetical protein
MSENIETTEVFGKPAAEKKGIPPWVSQGAGLVASTAIGLVLAAIGETAFQWLFDLSDAWGRVAFYTLLPAVAGATFQSGLQPNVPIGHRGVPQLFGGRLQLLLLGEGRHWFPGTIEEADVRLDVKGSGEMLIPAKDGTVMRSDFSFEYRVTDPYVYLSAKDPLGAILCSPRTLSVSWPKKSSMLSKVMIKSTGSM